MMNFHSELTVVFQPHRHTRTKSLIQDFVLSLSKANNVLYYPFILLLNLSVGEV